MSGMTLALALLLAGVVGTRTVKCSTVSPDSKCAGLAEIGSINGTGKLTPFYSREKAVLFVLLGIGFASVALAFLYNYIRKEVFHDDNNFNTFFDAGGKVSLSLTAVTVASKLLWPGDLLQSATVTAKYGLAGGYWYSVAAVISLCLYPMLTVHFKTRAPGAKTFLQAIYARFGTVTHAVFCCFALILNLVIFVILLTVSTHVLQGVFVGVSEEFCVFVMAALFGSYAFTGGLGATIYVCYLNAVVIVVLLALLISKVFYSSTTLEGGFSGMYQRVSCVKGPEENYKRSFFTFASEGAVIGAAKAFFGTAVVVFCDQSTWQSRIATKPLQGVLGFFAASGIWLAITSTIGTTMGFVYLDYSITNPSDALRPADVNKDLVTPFIAGKKLGELGSFSVLMMVIMASVSTGSAEVMAVASIVVYDIYQLHVKPFRRISEPGLCVLCGLSKPNQADRDDFCRYCICRCVQVAACEQCLEDRARFIEDPAGPHIYRCYVHGDYRRYQDTLQALKRWVILWVTLCIAPIGLLVVAYDVKLTYIFVFGFLLVLPSLPGALLAIIWVKTTSIAMIIGSMGGLLGGLTASMIVAATSEGGIECFLKDTTHNYPVLAWAITALILSVLLTVLISIRTHKIRTTHDEKVEWQKLRDIDNPLCPWADIYREDFPQLTRGDVPSYEELDNVYCNARRVARIGAAAIIMLVLLIPSIMMTLFVMSESQAQSWSTLLQGLFFLITPIVIVAPPVEEILMIVRQLRKNSRTGVSSGQA